jgi:hypothetical protein
MVAAAALLNRNIVTVICMRPGFLIKAVMVSMSVCRRLVKEILRCRRRADRMRAELAGAEHEQRKNQKKADGRRRT